MYAETVLLDALDLYAEILSVKDPKKALKTFDLSFYIDELLMNSLVYENSKIINQIRTRNRTEKCLLLYDHLYQAEHKILYLEQAFQLSEKTKSGVLKNYRSNIDLLHDTKEHNDNHRCIYKHLRCHFSVVLLSVSLCFPFYFF